MTLKGFPPGFPLRCPFCTVLNTLPQYITQTDSLPNDAPTRLRTVPRLASTTTNAERQRDGGNRSAIRTSRLVVSTKWIVLQPMLLGYSPRFVCMTIKAADTTTFVQQFKRVLATKWLCKTNNTTCCPDKVACSRNKLTFNNLKLVDRATPFFSVLYDSMAWRDYSTTTESPYDSGSSEWCFRPLRPVEGEPDHPDRVPDDVLSTCACPDEATALQWTDLPTPGLECGACGPLRRSRVNRATK